MQDTFARATHSAARPSARATIGYLVYKGILHTSSKSNRAQGKRITHDGVIETVSG